MPNLERRASAQSTADLETVVRRFPLVARSGPAARPLRARVARVSERAETASEGGSGALLKAAEAHNLAALIVSDAGMPDLAREMCLRQFQLYGPARPFTAGVAKLALQPLINLARLHTRDGLADAAHPILISMFDAVQAQRDTTIDGISACFESSFTTPDDHRSTVAWLWTVRLADGTRALTRSGRWVEACEHLQRHHGVGQQLLDGRQVAILAHRAAGDDAAAIAMLDAGESRASWQRALAGCLRVLCLPTGTAREAELTTMLRTFAALERNRGHVVFRIRLGIAVLDVASHHGAEPAVLCQLANDLVRDAFDAGDAYAAREVLEHPGCRQLMSQADHYALTDVVRAAGLGVGEITPTLLAQLHGAAHAAESTIGRAIAPGEHAPAEPTITGRPDR